MSETNDTLPTAEEVRGILREDLTEFVGKVPIAEVAALMTPRLPFPRPAFDAAKALSEIFRQESEVDELATIAERKKRDAKSAADEWKDAVETLGAMIRRCKQEQDDANREPEQLDLPHGPECAFERETGTVCAVCSAARAARAATNGGGAPVGQSTDSLGPDASPDAAAAPPLHDGPVLVRLRMEKTSDTDPEYYIEPDATEGGWRWGVGIAVAHVFESQVEAEAALTRFPGFENLDLEFVPVVDNDLADDGPVEMPDDDPEIVVGSLVIAKAQTGVCEIGARGVCVSVALDFGFIFEPDGKFDYFTTAEARRALTVTGELLEPLVGYEFVSDKQLKADYRKGVFAAAIGKPERKAKART